jgi:outer membrane receptor for ferrienterochelin and colicin
MKYILLPTLTLIFSMAGFTQEKAITVKNTNTIETFDTISDTIKNKKGETLKEVIVSSKIGVTQIEPQKIRFSTKDLPSQNGGTAGDILKNMLSVSMGGSPNQNRDIRYRGLGKGYTTVLINGKQSGIIGNNRETVLDMLPASQIDYIEIISSPTADQTSNGINGIVNIVTKKGAKTNQNGQIQVFADSQNGYNGSVLLQHATDNFSISGSFDKLKRNANKFDDGTQTKFNTDGSLKETIGIKKAEIKSFDNSTATAKLGYNTKNNWDFSAEYIYGEQIEDKEKEELNLTFSNTNVFKSGKKRFSPEYKTSKFHNPSLNINKNWEKSSLDFTFNTNLTTETKDNLQQDYTTNEAGDVNYTKIPAQQLLLDNVKFTNYFPSIAFRSALGEKGTIKTGFQSFLTNRTAQRTTTKLDSSSNIW